MLIIRNTLFMVKYDFFKNDGIPQYSIVKIVAIINNSCLVEDIKTLERVWVMDYDIYPLNDNDISGVWEYSKQFDEIAINLGLKS